jgi:hypothetical protein
MSRREEQSVTRIPKAMGRPPVGTRTSARLPPASRQGPARSETPR